MGFINRVLLFFYTLFFGIVSLGVILLVFNVIPERVLLNEYQYAVHQWQTGAIAGVVYICCFAHLPVSEKLKPPVGILCLYTVK